MDSPDAPLPTPNPSSSRPGRGRARLGVAVLALALGAGCSPDARPAPQPPSDPTFQEWAAAARGALEAGRAERLAGVGTGISGTIGPGSTEGTGDSAGSGSAVAPDGAADSGTADTRPAWAVPVGLHGWTVAPLDDAGVTTLTSDAGCIMATQQARVTFTTDDDREASQDLLVQLVGPEYYLPSQEPTLTVSAPGGSLELLQHSATFARPDSAVEYRFLSRAITEQGSGLLLSYSCPVDVFDEATWLDLLALTSVAHTTATTM